MDSINFIIYKDAREKNGFGVLAALFCKIKSCFFKNQHNTSSTCYCNDLKLTELLICCTKHSVFYVIFSITVLTDMCYTIIIDNLADRVVILVSHQE